MKKMSQQDLDRLGRKKGFKVKRKMGVQQKKPEPEVEDDVALSGAKATEAEVPAPALLPIMEKMTEILARMEARDAPVDIPVVTTGALSKAQAEIKPEPEPEPEPERPSVIPVVLRSVSHGPWTHTPHRDDDGQIVHVDSVNAKGKTWTHEFVRSTKDKLIEEVLTKSDSGLEFIHKFQRDRKTLINGVTTTPA